MENDKFFGHIPRNIRLALATIDMVLTYVLFTVQNNETIFKILGCKSVLWFKIVTLEFEGSEFDSINQHKEKDMKTVGNLTCYWENYSEYKLSDFVDLRMKKIIYIMFAADGSWSNQNQPDPNIPPQSFAVNLRKGNFSESNQNYYVKGNEYFRSNYVVVNEKESISEIKLVDFNSDMASELIIFDGLNEKYIIKIEHSDKYHKFIKTNHSELNNVKYFLI